MLYLLFQASSEQKDTFVAASFVELNNKPTKNQNFNKNIFFGLDCEIKAFPAASSIFYFLLFEALQKQKLVTKNRL